MKMKQGRDGQYDFFKRKSYGNLLGALFRKLLMVRQDAGFGHTLTNLTSGG